MDIDAGRKVLVDQGLRELIRARIVGHRREDENEIAHNSVPGFLYFVSSCCSVCEHVANDDQKPAPRRRKPKITVKPPARNRRFLSVLLLLVATVVIVDGLVGDRGLVAMFRARREHDALSGAISRQRAENARLREEARRLREDPSAIEEIARRELGLIKAGERVFIIRDAAPVKP
jgi:cell division protein FtsB